MPPVSLSPGGAKRRGSTITPPLHSVQASSTIPTDPPRSDSSRLGSRSATAFARFGADCSSSAMRRTGHRRMLEGLRTLSVCNLTSLFRMYFYNIACDFYGSPDYNINPHSSRIHRPEKHPSATKLGDFPGGSTVATISYTKP